MSKRQYPLDIKTLFGVSTMGVAQVIGNGLITGVLLIFITDYAGLYTGIAGRAAQIGTLLLLLGRVWDAVNDPLMGYLMDRSPRTRWGKFKPFMFFGTLVSGILIIALFNVPTLFSADSSKVAAIFILYFLFDTAFTLLPINPLVKSLSNDVAVRTKLVIYPRIVTTLFSILMAFFLTIAIALGSDGVTPNIGLTALLFMAPLTVISLVGIALVKEGNANADEEQVTVRDALTMFKVNRPFLISSLSGLFGGFIFTFISASVVFYIKYAFGVENFGAQTAIWGSIILLGILAGTLFAQVLQKRMTPGQGALVSNALAIVPLTLLWLINLAGPIRSPLLLYGLLFVAVFGTGMSYVPGTLIMMECMDYNKFKLGKSMEGMINAIQQMIMKIQAALSATLTGAVLIAVGYDATLYEDAATIPLSLYSGLGIVLFAVPALLGVIATVILWFYPLLRQEQRDAMYAEIERGAVVISAD